MTDSRKKLLCETTALSNGAQVLTMRDAAAKNVEIVVDVATGHVAEVAGGYPRGTAEATVFLLLSSSSSGLSVEEDKVLFPGLDTISIGMGHTTLRTETPAALTARAIEVVARAFSQPRLNEDSFKDAQQRLLSHVAAKEKDVAWREKKREMMDALPAWGLDWFGALAPALREDVSPATMKAIQLHHIRSFYDAFFRGPGAAIGLKGPVEHLKAVEVAGNAFTLPAVAAKKAIAPYQSREYSFPDARENASVEISLPLRERDGRKLEDFATHWVLTRLIDEEMQERFGPDKALPPERRADSCCIEQQSFGPTETPFEADGFLKITVEMPAVALGSVLEATAGALHKLAGQADPARVAEVKKDWLSGSQKEIFGLQDLQQNVALALHFGRNVSEGETLKLCREVKAEAVREAMAQALEAGTTLCLSGNLAHAPQQGRGLKLFQPG